MVELTATEGKMKLWNGHVIEWPRRVAIVGYGIGNNRVGFKARCFIHAALHCIPVHSFASDKLCRSPRNLCWTS